MTRPRGTRTTGPLLLLLLLSLILIPFNLVACTQGLRQIVTRNVTGVLLQDPTDRQPGSSSSIMEIVDEQTCSAALVRLTCRSLHSVLFVLEARYLPERDDACVYDRDSRCAYKRLLGNVRHLQRRRYYLQSRYGLELDENPHDFRSSINRRCSGHHHCRYKVTSDHPEALFWKPANIHVKYACIPDGFSCDFVIDCIMLSRMVGSAICCNFSKSMSDRM
uniref:Uncharacterized protein n=1 Tax=Trichogramma kaykai TaxID=54128 RepID=A0ABD2X604_9HYME